LRKEFVLASIVALLLAGFVLAQSDSDYQGWMKMNAANAGSLGKNIQAKNGEGAAADAMKLEATLKQVEAYWQQKNVPDAVGFAQKGQAAAAAVAKAASAGDMDTAMAQMKSMQGNCGGCHMAHREGTPGSFKMK
jgi:hypothetical protein